jgi:hypothetical protein
MSTVNVPTFQLPKAPGTGTGKRARRRAARQRAAALAAALVPVRPKSAKSQRRKTGKSFTGKGDYFTDAGESAGRAVGGFLGRSAGSALSTFLGRGAYTVKRNSIMKESTGLPMMKSSSRFDGVSISNKEFIGDVIATGSTAWSVNQTFNINPGLSATFAYLSQMAIGFEEIEWDGMVLVYEPSSGSISTTQGLGTVILATQYDMQDPGFLSEVEMMDYEFASSNVPFEPMYHPIECDPKQNQLSRFYVRTGLLTGTTTTIDPRYNEYDLGRISVATVGVPAGSGVILGKLWLVYKGKFFKPKLYGGVLGREIMHDYFVSTTVTTGSGAALTSLGTMVAGSNNTLGGLCTVTGYTFPTALNEGSYFVQANFLTPSGISTWTPTNIALTNAGNLIQINQTVATGDCTQQSFGVIITITGPSAHIDWSGAINVGTANQSGCTAGVYVTQVQPPQGTVP